MPESIPGAPAHRQWEQHNRGFASRIMRSMGWTPGEGLGKDATGIVEPISAGDAPVQPSIAPRPQEDGVWSAVRSATDKPAVGLPGMLPGSQPTRVSAPAKAGGRSAAVAPRYDQWLKLLPGDGVSFECAVAKLPLVIGGKGATIRALQAKYRVRISHPAKEELAGKSTALLTVQGSDTRGLLDAVGELVGAGAISDIKKVELSLIHI
eukprot:TRINITY_DN35200_c0_g1_i1.p2 TRINITY_DN35200_c0_g1~~TRINITY_DN35200_c0_g1_i1.p2  ORF type:complete len:208 (-),score=46.79 TRINITY_DN35200_c0_g1_i1:142-765(-)